MSEDVFQSPKKKGRIAIFLSGRGSNFVAIHNAIVAGKINAEIVLVFSNKKEAPGLKIAQERNLETLYLNPKEYPSRNCVSPEHFWRNRYSKIVCLFFVILLFLIGILLIP